MCTRLSATRRGRRSISTGSASRPQFDGYASDVIQPGWSKKYEYPNYQPARSLWYHDHAIGHTAENAYYGLIGQYELHDEWERSLPIPIGRYDIPLALTDALFNNDGSLLFTLEDDSGQWGDVILVNGRPWPVMQVERRKYRFRIVGAALSRSWRLSLDSGEPLVDHRHRWRTDAAPQSVHQFPACLRRALRGGHRFRQVPDRAAGHPEELEPEEQPQLREHRQDDGLRRDE